MPSPSDVMCTASSKLYQESDCVKRILLKFNVENSEVELIDEELKERMIKLIEDHMPMLDIDRLGFIKEDTSCFDPSLKKDLVFLHPDLVKFCKDLHPGMDGFHRVVFFLAVVSLNPI